MKILVIFQILVSSRMLTNLNKLNVFNDIPVLVFQAPFVLIPKTASMAA
jgi:hypothetical protein